MRTSITHCWQVLPLNHGKLFIYKLVHSWRKGKKSGGTKPSSETMISLYTSSAISSPVVSATLVGKSITGYFGFFQSEVLVNFILSATGYSNQVSHKA
jgi:hypothetical protein